MRGESFDGLFVPLRRRHDGALKQPPRFAVRHHSDFIGGANKFSESVAEIMRKSS
jgi:hypothetical protein